LVRALPDHFPYAGGQPKRSISLTALEIHKRAGNDSPRRPESASFRFRFTPPFPSAPLRETAALTPPPGSSLPLSLKTLPFRWRSTPGLSS